MEGMPRLATKEAGEVVPRRLQISRAFSDCYVVVAPRLDTSTFTPGPWVELMATR
jgi:hypothetical protein